MRELATSKLAQAYRLDEVAASVATMQSASALDSVATLVLQRNPANTDAKYVRFFHEKIPSRMMAEYTSLTPLDEIVANEPGHAQAAVLRTRALTRIFKDDTVGALRDLTESLAICRLEMGKQMRMGQGEGVVATKEEADKRRMWSRDWVHENKATEEEQPRGMELQLLFQRGNQYLSLASQSVRIALEEFRAAQRAAEQARDDAQEGAEAGAPQCTTAEETEAYKRALEAREAVRKNAKRALKDYTTFLAQLDYAFATDVRAANVHGHGHENGNGNARASTSSLTASVEDESEIAHTTALVRRDRVRESSPSQTARSQWPSSTALPVIYDIPTLLSPSPPSNLPPFPPLPNFSTSTTLALRSSTSNPPAQPQRSHQNETVTYHPLLPETLHALLLAHALLQTPPTTLFRIANNVARLARLADGYPFFLSARSPARADWAEVLRKTGNWIGLSKTWEGLLKMNADGSAVGIADEGKTEKKKKSKAKVNGAGGEGALVKVTESKSVNGISTNGTTQLRERIHKEAVIEALGDERVVDDDTFQRAVEARERRAWRELEADTVEQQQNGHGMVEEVQDELDHKHDNGHVDGEAVAHKSCQADCVADNGQEMTIKNGAFATDSTTTSIPSTTNGNSTISHEPDPTTSSDATTPTVSHRPQPIPESSSTTKTVKPLANKDPTVKDEEYLLGTERASAIAAWVLEAPPPGSIVDVVGDGGKKAKGRARRKKASAVLVQ